MCHHVEYKDLLRDFNMTKLSIKKMQEIRATVGLSYKDLAAATGISESTITKLFGGFQINPSSETIIKIAEALNCGVDDFLERDTEPTSAYYLDRKTAELAQQIANNPNIKAIFRATRDLSPDDIEFVMQFIEKIKKK